MSDITIPTDTLRLTCGRCGYDNNNDMGDMARHLGVHIHDLAHERDELRQQLDDLQQQYLGRVLDRKGTFLGTGSAKEAAREYLIHNGQLRGRYLERSKFVKLTEDNAGMILAAFPEQVRAIQQEPDGTAVWCHADGGVHARKDYSPGQWLRVHDDHLTLATDEETKSLEEEAL